MKIYEEGTLEEWSRKLRSKYGNKFRLYGNSKETLERWQVHLSSLLGYRFEIFEGQEETLKAWSNIIGG